MLPEQPRCLFYVENVVIHRCTPVGRRSRAAGAPVRLLALGTVRCGDGPVKNFLFTKAPRGRIPT